MPVLVPENILFFETPAQFREWLEKNSETSKELWVGFYKVGTKKPSLTWSQAVDQALCFGWIDGIRKSIDESSYTNRFTPRNPKSLWSAINIKKVEELMKQGLMKPAGLKLFELRKEDKSDGTYSYEQPVVEFSEPYLSIFKKNEKAWNHFSAKAPSYRKVATRWVMSARQDATRLKRLETLIADSEKDDKIDLLKL